MCCARPGPTPSSPGALTTTTVNGLPVVTALSNGKEWTFRLSAIRIGNTTYRLIMATRGNGRIWKGSSSSTLQQRPAGSAGRSAADPAAQAADRHRPARRHRRKRLAARMPVDRPLERFLLLNGLDRNASLTVGERYKIVVE